MTAHDLVVVHTMAGNLHGTDAMFRGGGYSGTEAHYGLGGRWGPDSGHRLDGVIWQWQDRGRQADANLDANPRAISVETADNAPGDPADIARWTSRQAAVLAVLLAWECSLDAHRSCPADWVCHRGVTWSGMQVAIPPVLVADSTPRRRGLAYHRQGIDPWRVKGGEKWSTSTGKACPGPARIRQFTEEIIPAVQAWMRGDDMDFKEFRDTPFARNLNGGDPEKRTVNMQTFAERTDAKLDALVAAVAEDREAVLDRLAAQDKALAALAASLNTLAARIGAVTPGR